MDSFRYVQLLLKYRPRSEYEIRSRLKIRGYEDEEIKEVINKFKKLDLIDDFNFAKFWINFRVSHNPKSMFYIEMELKKKGLSDEIIKKTFEEFKNIDEKDLAFRLIEKKVRNLGKVKDPLVKERRLYAYLQRRGFKYGLIKELMQDCFRNN
ncbi:MAG: regulatory protein RecX [Candidatus Saelkia tenebricola]|nr:regulatory protein RecX [Candidatus Saelkia tenebricola]